MSWSLLKLQGGLVLEGLSNPPEASLPSAWCFHLLTDSFSQLPFFHFLLFRLTFSWDGVPLKGAGLTAAGPRLGNSTKAGINQDSWHPTPRTHPHCTSHTQGSEDCYYRVEGGELCPDKTCRSARARKQSLCFVCGQRRFRARRAFSQTGARISLLYNTHSLAMHTLTTWKAVRRRSTGPQENFPSCVFVRIHRIKRTCLSWNTNRPSACTHASALTHTRAYTKVSLGIWPFPKSLPFLLQLPSPSGGVKTEGVRGRVLGGWRLGFTWLSTFVGAGRQKGNVQEGSCVCLWERGSSGGGGKRDGWMDGRRLWLRFGRADGWRWSARSRRKCVRGGGDKERGRARSSTHVSPSASVWSCRRPLSPMTTQREESAGQTRKTLPTLSFLTSEWPSAARQCVFGRRILEYLVCEGLSELSVIFWGVSSDLEEKC